MPSASSSSACCATATASGPIRPGRWRASRCAWASSSRGARSSCAAPACRSIRRSGRRTRTCGALPGRCSPPSRGRASRVSTAYGRRTSRARTCSSPMRSPATCSNRARRDWRGSSTSSDTTPPGGPRERSSRRSSAPPGMPWTHGWRAGPPRWASRSNPTQSGAAEPGTLAPLPRRNDRPGVAPAADPLAGFLWGEPAGGGGAEEAGVEVAGLDLEGAAGAVHQVFDGVAEEGGDLHAAGAFLLDLAGERLLERLVRLEAAAGEVPVLVLAHDRDAAGGVEDERVGSGARVVDDAGEPRAEGRWRALHYSA